MSSTQRGFVLIEAIIALVVSAVGLLGVALYTSSMVGESSQTKSESEALAIAQKEIEVLRGYAGSYSLGSIVSDTPSWPASTAVIGTRETYSLSGDVVWSASVGTSLADASVTVSWTEGSVTLNTTIVEDMFDSKAEGGNGDGQAGSNPFELTPPTGGAKYGADAPGGNLPEDVTLTGDQISVVSVQQGEGGGIKLVFTDDNNIEKELLTYSGSAFSEIRGVVYVDYSATGLDSSEETYNKLVVRASDTGVCPRSDAHLAGDGSGDWFVEYRCFFGAGWYGNIDVVYDAIANEKNDTYRNQCVGDPNESDDGTDLSRHPNWIEPLDDKREYRGYGLVVTPDGSYESDTSGNLLYVAQGLAEGAVYGYGVASAAGQSLVIGDGNHDFVLETQSEISNPVTSEKLDIACGTVMSSVSVATYSGHFPGAGVDAGAFDGFDSNNGDFVCLEVNGTFSCPANIPDALGTVTSAATYTISGTISQASTSTLVSTATSQFPTGVINNCTRDGDGNLSCTSEPICSNTNSSYSCSVIVASGASWSGSITHSVSDANYSICEPSGGVQTFASISSSLSGSEVVVLESSEVCGSEVTEQTYTVVMTNNTSTTYDLGDYSEYIIASGVSYPCQDSTASWKKNGKTVTLTCDAPATLNNSDTLLLDGSLDRTVDITDVTGQNVTAEYP
jgi:Tfp pilus assembly protein PilV